MVVLSRLLAAHLHAVLHAQTNADTMMVSAFVVDAVCLLVSRIGVKYL